MSLPVPLSRLQRGVAAFALIAPVFVATLPAHAAVITADDILGQFNAVVTNNFSTNSDVEGRLVWGINDFDEACELPYAADLVRLATSAALATEDNHLGISRSDAALAILDGYTAALSSKGRPVVLAEHHSRLRRLATGDLRWEFMITHELPLAALPEMMRTLGARSTFSSKVLFVPGQRAAR